MMDYPSLLKFAFWKTNVYDFYSSLMHDIIGVKSIIPFDFGRWRWKNTFFPKSFLFWEKRSKEQTNFLWFLISSGPKSMSAVLPLLSKELKLSLLSHFLFLQSKIKKSVFFTQWSCFLFFSRLPKKKKRKFDLKVI